MHSSMRKREIEACHKAFATCMKVCEAGLNIEREKLMKIRKELDTCTCLSRNARVQLSCKLVKIFIQVVRIEAESKNILRCYTRELNNLK